MPVTVDDVITKMEQWCSSSLACSWDSCGLQVGASYQFVHRILVALDISIPVIAEAKERGIDFIITHHPLIFSPLKNLCWENYPQSLVKALLQANICHYAAHTNLDVVAGGVNDVLARKLQLQQVMPLAAAGDMDGLGRIGVLPQPMSFSQLEGWVKKQLGVSYLKVVPVEKQIEKIAVCGGSGMDLLLAAKRQGADCLLSAEGKHHQGLMAREMNIGLIDGGHYGTEKMIIPMIARYLQDNFPQITVVESETEEDAWLIR